MLLRQGAKAALPSTQKQTQGGCQGYTEWNKKKNLQGTNSEGEEAKIQINNLEHKEEISIQPEQQEETEFKKK